MMANVPFDSLNIYEYVLLDVWLSPLSEHANGRYWFRFYLFHRQASRYFTFFFCKPGRVDDHPELFIYFLFIYFAGQVTEAPPVSAARLPVPSLVREI